jgi:hypothetical protein
MFIVLGVFATCNFQWCSAVNSKDDHQFKTKCLEHSCEASRMWLPLLFGNLISDQRTQLVGEGEVVSLEVLRQQ